MSNSFIRLIDRTLLSTPTPGHSGPRNNDNEEVICITQNASITGASDCLMSYLGHTLQGGLTLLQICSRYILLIELTRLSYMYVH